MLNQLIWPKGKLVNGFSSEIISVDEFFSKYDSGAGDMHEKEFVGTNVHYTHLHEFSEIKMHERETQFSISATFKKECNTGTPVEFTLGTVQRPQCNGTGGVLTSRFHRGAALGSIAEEEQLPPVHSYKAEVEACKGIGPAQTTSGNFIDLLAPLEENIHAHRCEIKSLTQHENFINEGSRVHEEIFGGGLHVVTGLPLGIRIKQSTAAFMQSEDYVQHIPPEEVETVYLYVDGSYDKESVDCHTTSAVACITEDVNKKQSLAFTWYGVTAFDPFALTFVGAMLPSSSFCSELCGQIMARLNALHHVHKVACRSSVVLEIVYDNTAADYCANSAKFVESQPQMAKIAGLLNRMLKISTRFVFKSAHVYSHSDQPWNELADSLCTFAREQCRVLRSDGIPGAPLTPRRMASLDMFLSCRAAEGTNVFELPEYANSQKTIFGLEPRVIADKIDNFHQVKPVIETAIPNELRALQYNIKTLKAPAARKILTKKVKENKFFLVCLQETQGYAAGVFGPKDGFSNVRQQKNPGVSDVKYGLRTTFMWDTLRIGNTM